MTAAPFAARQQRVTAAVIKRLANCTGLLDGVAVAGILSAGYSQVLAGIATARPHLVVDSAVAAAVTQASGCVADAAYGGAPYRVSSPEPDGTGLTRLVLERQP